MEAHIMDIYMESKNMESKNMESKNNEGESIEGKNNEVDSAEGTDAAEDSLKLLQEKCDNLNKEVQSLENMRTNMEESIKTMHSEFENINKNIGSILVRLDGIKIDSDHNSNDNINPTRIKFSVKKLIGRPLRRLAVGTLSGIYIVADKALESAYDVKENAEDIFAEAQYRSKKRRSNI
jgi:hypothetical protein